MNDLELKEFRKKYNLSQKDIAEITGVGLRTVRSWEYGERNVSGPAVKLLDKYTRTVQGDNFESVESSEDGNMIPLYDDVSTFGSNVETDLTPVSNPTEYIDAGTWFGKTKITAAIRHYGESMLEYPNGCILALKEILDFDNVVYGRNYVIETDEIRVTKRIQSNNDIAYITAYSTNTETYPDGKQIHEPFHIKKVKIRRVLLVIGRIVKEHSSGAIITL